MNTAGWFPTEDELHQYLGADCGELAQAICDLRPGWTMVVRYPEREADQSEWHGLPWGSGLPLHHVAARAPDGRTLDIRGFRVDPGWMIAEPYMTQFKVTDESRDLARRLLAALAA
jgi:hypothetical protein